MYIKTYMKADREVK